MIPSYALPKLLRRTDEQCRLWRILDCCFSFHPKTFEKENSCAFFFPSPEFANVTQISCCRFFSLLKYIYEASPQISSPNFERTIFLPGFVFPELYIHFFILFNCEVYIFTYNMNSVSKIWTVFYWQDCWSTCKLFSYLGSFKHQKSYLRTLFSEYVVVYVV